MHICEMKRTSRFAPLQIQLGSALLFVFLWLQSNGRIELEKQTTQKVNESFSTLRGQRSFCLLTLRTPHYWAFAPGSRGQLTSVNREVDGDAWSDGCSLRSATSER